MAMDESDVVARSDAAALVAGFGRSRAMLAIGLAALVSASPSVRAELPVVSLQESRSTPSVDKLDGDLIAGLRDSGILQKALRATEMQNLLQAGGLPPSASYAQAAAGSQTRARPWSLSVSGAAMFWDYDQVTLAAYLPVKGRNAAKKIAEKLFDSQDAGSLVSNMQALSLIARGRINTEFTYSTQFSKRSSLEASATLRLNADPNTGKSDLVLGLHYRAAF